MRRVALGSGVAAALACGGLFADDTKLAAFVGVVPELAPEAVVPAFVAVAADALVVSPMCGDALRSWAREPRDDRGTVAMRILGTPTLWCPAACADPNATGPDGFLAACDAGAPDRVFGGPLAPLRPAMDPLEYALVRAVAEAAEAAYPEVAGIHDDLAVSLAVRATPDLLPKDAPTVSGSFAPPTGPFEALAPQLRACPEVHLQHRLVLDPTGAVRGVAGFGECAAGVLRGVTFPATGRWEYVDVQWSVPPDSAVPDAGG